MTRHPLLRRPLAHLLAGLMLASPLLATVPSALAQDGETPTSNAEIDSLARQLLDNVDDTYRGASSRGRMTMNVKTRRYERSMTMDVWSRGEDEFLARIVAPAQESGTSTLRVEDNIWNYLPRVDRTVKLSASMMGGSWMGSHFTNDDLVQSSRMAEDYTYEIVSDAEAEPAGIYVIHLVPKPEAPVVWGKVEVRVRASDRMAEVVHYYDEDGELMRSMEFLDPTDFGDQRLPARMRLTEARKEGEFSEIVYEELEFDVDIPERTFTIQSLRP